MDERTLKLLAAAAWALAGLTLIIGALIR